MVPAKLFGVRVPKYFVGFGKTLWSTRRGETEYGFKLFPLGGFVQLLGMYPPRNPNARNTWLTRLADEARAAEWDEITDADRGRLLYEKPVWQRVIVMAGGITMNLLICFVLLWAVIGTHGAVRQQTTVASVPQCLVLEARADPSTCLPTDPRTPSAEAGLRAGDKVVSFNGVAVRDYPHLSSLIRANLDGPATLVVERGGEQVTLPTVHTRIMSVQDRLDPSRAVQAGWLGVVPTSALVRGGPVEVVQDMGTLSAQTVVALAQFPVKVFNVVRDVVTGQPRDLYSPVSIVGASTIAGEVAASEASVGDKVVMFASLLASVNLFLALFNLVPLPPLDGGHIVGALYDGAKRGLARLFRRPDPGHADTARMLPVAYAVGGFLLVCGVLLIVADIVSPLKIF